MKAKLKGATRICLIISAAIMLAALALALGGRGAQPSMDIAGGLALEYRMNGAFEPADAKEALTAQGLEQFEVSKAGADETVLAVHVKNIAAEGVAPLRAGLEQALKAKYPAMDETNVQVRFESAEAGAALKGNGIFLMVLAGLLMFGYIYFRFDFNFAAAALFGIVHDVLIMLSLTVILRSFVDFGSGFITAVFAAIAASTLYSAVVFRRVMENRKALRLRSLSLTEVAQRSIKESTGRLAGVALPLLIMLAALALIGTGDARAFAWPAFIGILSGLYGALFINGYLWALMESNGSGEKEKTQKA